MCNKGTPSTTSTTGSTNASSQASNTSQTGNTQGQQLQTGFSQLGPTPETLALYQQFLQQAQGVSQTPVDTLTLPQAAPWTAAQDQAANYQFNLGQQGMNFVPQSSDLLQQGAQSTVGQIPGVASSIISPWAGQAVGYGQSQGSGLANYAQGQGAAIGAYGTGLAAKGPQLQQFSQGAIDQYMSPYINDVVNATQNQFTNANAQQGNALLSQGIKQGNAFGGDRAGIAAAQLGNQQQLAQAPVIAGLYNTGYNTALGEFNTQNALAAQLGQTAMQGQIAGGQLGVQGTTAGGQLGMAGLGLGLNASTAANQQAIGALGQNQNAALQGGNMLGNLGALQYSQNLAGGSQAVGASQLYPAYLQNLMNMQAGNESTIAANPYQNTGWYGSLLQGMGPLTGSQQQNVNAALSNYLMNQQGTSLINGTSVGTGTGTTTPPQPNSFLQAAGLGIAGLGLLAKRGGSIPRLPHRAGGGGISGVPYAGGHSYIPPLQLQPTHLAAPNTSATDIKLPNLAALTFPGMTMPSLSSAAPASSQQGTGAQGTLGQASALLGNKQVQSGLKDIGGFLFGNNDATVSAAVNDPVGFGGGSPAGDLPVQAKRGGLIPHRDEGGDTFDDRFDASFPDREQSGAANWVDSLVSNLGMDNVPMPQPRPAEADAPENMPTAESWTAPDNSGGQPEEANVGLPELDGRAMPEREAPPSAMAQMSPVHPSMRQGPRRIDFPGGQQQPQGVLQRWASNPLTQFGLGLASARGAGLSGVAEGLNLGLGNLNAQRVAQDRLDKNYKVDTSGKTTRLIFANHAIDTGLPTATDMRVAQQRRGKVPAGMILNDEGVLVPMPRKTEGQQAQAAQAPQPEAKIAQSPGETGETPEKAQFAEGSISDAFTENGVDMEKLLQDPPVKGKPKRPEVLDQYPDVADQVIAISEGRMQAPTGSRKDKTATRIMEALPKYDPAYDQTALSRRQRTATNFATGVEGRNITAANTFGQHLNEMNTIMEELKNGDWPDITAVKNVIARHAGALSPELKKVQKLLGRYDEVSKALGDEGAKVFAGQQSALADREGWAEKLPRANEPLDVARDKLSQMVKLVDGRLDALSTQYNNGMSTSHKSTDFVSPKTRQVFDRIRAGGTQPSASEPKASTGAPAAAPAKAEHPDQIQNGVLYQFDEATGRYKGVRKVQ